MYQRSGILLVDKEKGMSSFHVAKKVKECLGFKKVGHGGTLDPFATGLIILLLGQGTKLQPYLLEYKKTYQGTIRLGIETDTGDPEGKITKEMEVPKLELESINNMLKNHLIGEVIQDVPMFSAVKRHGVPLYKFARKGIKIDNKKKKVYIYSINIHSIKGAELNIEITCSSGTYIRSVGIDIGKLLQTCAHIKELRRISIGNFNVRDAIASSSISPGQRDEIINKIIPLPSALPLHKSLKVDDDMAKRIKNGYNPLLKGNYDYIKNGENVKIMHNNQLIAIGRVKRFKSKDGVFVKLLRVFNQDNINKII